MKKTLLTGLATLLFLLTSTGIAKDWPLTQEGWKNSKTTGLYDNVTILQEQINSLTERIERIETLHEIGDRFTDMGNGTIRDNVLGLIWLKDASCDNLPHTEHGIANWEEAIVAAAVLTSGTCGLSDGSAAGDWRLPTKTEWEKFVSTDYINPALVNTVGDAQWSEGDPFTGVLSDAYWSSTEQEYETYAYYADMANGWMYYNDERMTTYRVWPVRSDN
jgi:hypothetical protein